MDGAGEGGMRYRILRGPCLVYYEKCVEIDVLASKHKLEDLIEAHVQGFQTSVFGERITLHLLRAGARGIIYKPHIDNPHHQYFGKNMRIGTSTEVGKLGNWKCKVV
jgi:hypothetical protein